MLYEGHYTHQYFDIKPGHVRRPETAIRWSEGLPAEWREQVIAPLYFDHYKEYLVKAARILGRDEDDLPCYCAFCYVLEEEPDPAHPERCRALAYAETVRAWRLRDGRWLIHRIIIHHGEQAKARGFFSLSPLMPR